MKIAITGASGQVAELLIPILCAENHELLLIGRSAPRLQRLYPDLKVCGYDELESYIEGYETVVHLAVLNNNVSADIEEFRRTNVDLTLHVLQMSAKCNVKTFLFISSIHALDQNNLTPYAVTKREASQRLADVENIKIDNLYLPYVYGSHFLGKLKFLNSLPKFISSALFAVISSLAPTVHVSKLAKRITQDFDSITHGTVLSDQQFSNWVFRFVKRSVDIGFAVFVPLFFGWLFLLIWLAVRLDSPGPGVFAQQRVGKDGAVFTCYKFRTMKQNTAQAGTHDVSASAVTKIGGFLRRTKIDELPQVWNILRNEISLVGPRPCLPVQQELLKQRTLRGVLQVKPGITGLSQINGFDMSDPVRLASEDYKYVALQGLILELKIIVQTLIGRGSGDRIIDGK